MKKRVEKIRVGNPLAKFFGLILKELRGTDLLQCEVADQLAISPSAYRMIESGTAGFGWWRCFDLVAIKCFQEIRIEKLCLYVYTMSFLDKFCGSPEELCKGITSISPIVPEIALLLNKYESICFMNQKNILFLQSKDDLIADLKSFFTEPEQTISLKTHCNAEGKDLLGDLKPLNKHGYQILEKTHLFLAKYPGQMSVLETIIDELTVSEEKRTD